MDTTTVFPLLLYIAAKLEGPLHTQEWEAVLMDLESFLIRRIVCGLTTKNYNKLFLDCKTYLDGKDNAIPAALREFLLSKQGESERWPSDEDFPRHVVGGTPVHADHARSVVDAAGGVGAGTAHQQDRRYAFAKNTHD